MPEAKTKTFRWLFPLSPPTSPAPLAHSSPRLEALPDLSYCFKPKFTVSVGGQDPLSPPPPRGPWDSVEAGGPAHLPSAPAWPGGRSTGRGEETVALNSPHPPGSRPLGPGAWGALLPTMGCFLGALQTPFSRTKFPITLGVWIPAKELGKKVRLSPQTPYGGPQLKAKDRVCLILNTPGQAPLLRRLLGLFPKKPPHTPLHKPPLPRGRGPSAPSPCTPHLCSV